MKPFCCSVCMSDLLQTWLSCMLVHSVSRGLFPVCVTLEVLWRWSFFTGFNAIKLQVLHKQETDLRSQNAQKHAGQPCLQQVGHAN